jgi:predicted ribosome quality control (RQC) complex YloA/Tae2 family protein
MMKPPNSEYLSLGKCWQTLSSGLIWQVTSPGLPSKAFLHLDPQNGISWAPDRGADHPRAATGAFAALGRKYLTGGKITYILEKENSIWIWIQKKDPFWIRLEDNILELISSTGESLIRLSSKGTFTHKKKTDPIPLEGFLADSAWENRLSFLLEQFVSKGQPEIAEQKEALPQKSIFQREAKRKLTRRIRTVRQAIEKTRASLPKKEDIEAQRKKAKLLGEFSYLIQPQSHCLVLDPLLSGEPTILSIELHPDQTPGQMIEAFYLQAKKSEKALGLGKVRLEKEESVLGDLQKISMILSEDSLPEPRVTELLREAGLLAQKPPVQNSTPLGYSLFTGTDNIVFLVGKTASQNDALTKSAKSQDYWCHVVSGGGSHVVIPKKFKTLNPQTKREAGILAVHFSKLRKDQAGEVYFTTRGHLKKKKSMAPGLWIVEKSEILFIRYTDLELRSLLEYRTWQFNQIHGSGIFIK